MLILAAFAALALLAAGSLALRTGDTLVFSGALLLLCLVVLAGLPLVPALLHSLQQTIDAAAPLALQ